MIELIAKVEHTEVGRAVERLGKALAGFFKSPVDRGFGGEFGQIERPRRELSFRGKLGADRPGGGIAGLIAGILCLLGCFVCRLPEALDLMEGVGGFVLVAVDHSLHGIREDRYTVARAGRNQRCLGKGAEVIVDFQRERGLVRESAIEHLAGLLELLAEIEDFLELLAGVGHLPGVDMLEEHVDRWRPGLLISGERSVKLLFGVR